MGNICIIPARGGSKRIPKKNIKDFNGKPIISYIIEAAQKSNNFDEIMVSTDSKEIEEVAKKYGAKVPFLREKKLSDDVTGTHEVVKDFLKKINSFFKYICCIYPTAPLMRTKDLIKGFKTLKKNNNEYVFSGNLPKKSGSVGSKKNFMLEDSGQFYWGSDRTWRTKSKILNKNSKIIKIPRAYAHDLNTLQDLEILKKKKIKLLKNA